jgi:uncharacterized damage-inducible protein DinB
MLPSDYQDLVNHMEWADSVVWESVLALFEAQSDTGMRERLYHIHVVQWAYLQVWAGEPLDVRDGSSFEDLRAIYEWVRDYYHRATEYLDAVDAEALQRQVQFPWADQLVERWGSAQPATLAETILQITAHTTYHRGQINTRLRELGGEPPLTDFIAWIWMGRPLPAWEGPAA